MPHVRELQSPVIPVPTIIVVVVSYKKIHSAYCCQCPDFMIIARISLAMILAIRKATSWTTMQGCFVVDDIQWVEWYVIEIKVHLLTIVCSLTTMAAVTNWERLLSILRRRRLARPLISTSDTSFLSQQHYRPPLPTLNYSYSGSQKEELSLQAAEMKK